MEQTLTSQQADLLLEDETSLNLQKATTGQRFANYLIDIIVFVALFLFIGLIAQIDFNSPLISILQYPSLVLYYFIFEGVFKGRTPAKFITGTKAVFEDGSPITWYKALTRSLCRIVPFEPLSGFSAYPWHDKWTDTIVIKNKK